MEKLPDSAYAVLGLVDKLPRSSGYDLVAVAQQSLDRFWPISQTLLYRELQRLANLGWVNATRVAGRRLPSKTVYETTPVGQRVLADWLATPPAGVSRFRSGFLVRFFFSHRVPAERLRAMLGSYRDALQAERDELRALVDKLASRHEPSARIGRLAALHGLKTAEARLDWVADTVDELEREPIE